MSVWRKWCGGRRGMSLCIGILLLLALAALFFDSALSATAVSCKAQAENETLRLGEILQLTRIFGVADATILFGLLMGLAGQRRLFMRLIISLLLVAAVVHPLKAITNRARPDDSNYRSFPSGDTATAFVLPVVCAGNPVLAAGGLVVATGTAVSRVFFAKHYPSDVLTGAAVGLFCGLVGCWLLRKRRALAGGMDMGPCSGKLGEPGAPCGPEPGGAMGGAGLSGTRNGLVRGIRWVLLWVPSQRFFLVATIAFLFFEVVNAAVDGHHRHIVQFLAWYGPVMALYVSHVRLRLRFGRRRDGWGRSARYGQLYFFIRRAVSCSGVLGVLLLVLPWLADAPGLRAPAFSAGLLLILFARLAGRGLRSGRFGGVAVDSAALLYIVQFYALGYLLGIL